jgi:hypothetical protein
LALAQGPTCRSARRFKIAHTIDIEILEKTVHSASATLL